MLAKRVCAVVEKIECSPITLLLMFKYTEDSYRVEIDQATYGYKFNDKARDKFKTYILSSDNLAYVGNSYMMVNPETEELAELIFYDLESWISKPEYYERIN